MSDRHRITKKDRTKLKDIIDGSELIVRHKKQCLICQHEKTKEIEKVLLHPTMDLYTFAKEYGIDYKSVKAVIIRHSIVLKLNLEKQQLSDWVNYFTGFMINSDKATVSNILTYNDQQQKREKRYGDVNINFDFIKKDINNVMETMDVIPPIAIEDKSNKNNTIL